jgi:uncharacterized protein YxjI
MTRIKKRSEQRSNNQKKHDQRGHPFFSNQKSTTLKFRIKIEDGQHNQTTVRNLIPKKLMVWSTGDNGVHISIHNITELNGNTFGSIYKFRN